MLLHSSYRITKPEVVAMLALPLYRNGINPAMCESFTGALHNLAPELTFAPRLLTTHSRCQQACCPTRSTASPTTTAA